MTDPSLVRVSLNDDMLFSYTPYPGFGVSDTVTKAANVAANGPPSNPATVTIDVTDQAPVAINDVYDVHNHFFDGNVLDNDTDSDGDRLRVSAWGAPSHGQLISRDPDGSFEYQPDLYFKGVDS